MIMENELAEAMKQGLEEEVARRRKVNPYMTPDTFWKDIKGVKVYVSRKVEKGKVLVSQSVIKHPVFHRKLFGIFDDLGIESTVHMAIHPSLKKKIEDLIIENS